ncbi:hypothetical protein Patl1_03264 [Pistacia atlantica]|uniref:Uncharacterized protein n=1 Tax=Pistacia atlantica TaxID=434234 RepID=A0ACC1CAS4_9ROSI|nr:hypothetical protein Patl1_03264 [Pistacia atlantica]
MIRHLMNDECRTIHLNFDLRSDVEPFGLASDEWFDI